MLRFPRGRAVRVFLVSLFVFITGQCLLGAIVSSKWKEMAQLVTEDRLSMGSGIRWLWMVAFWWWHLKTSYFDWFGFGEKFSGVGCLFLFLLPDAIVSVISQTSTEMQRLARRDFMVRTVCNSGYTNSVRSETNQKTQTIHMQQHVK